MGESFFFGVLVLLFVYRLLVFGLVWRIYEVLRVFGLFWFIARCFVKLWVAMIMMERDGDDGEVEVRLEGCFEYIIYL